MHPTPILATFSNISGRPKDIESIWLVVHSCDDSVVSSSQVPHFKKDYNPQIKDYK